MRSVCIPLIILFLTGCMSGPEADDSPVDRIDEIRRQFDIPGFSYVVIEHDTVKAIGASGAVFQGSHIAVGTDSMFQLGSISKGFTAFVAQRLVAEGRIAWGSRLLEIIPEWEPGSNRAYLSVTLADLLSHRAGIQPFTLNVVDRELPLVSADPVARRNEFCRYVLELDAVPGRGFEYSNAGYTLAAAMLERVSGSTWEQLCLDTAHSYGFFLEFGRPSQSDPDQPWPHRMAWFGRFRPVTPREEYLFPAVLAPAGNISMSAEDIAIYTRVLLRGFRGEDDRFTKESARFLMFGNEGYAYGWKNAVEESGDTYAWHSGSDGFYYSHIMLFQNLDAGIAILTNAPSCRKTESFINEMRNYLKQVFIYNMQ